MIKKFKQWSIRDKLFTGFGIMIYFIVLVGGYIIFSTTGISKQSRHVEITDFTGVTLSTEMKEIVLKIDRYVDWIAIRESFEYVNDIKIQTEKFYVILAEFQKNTGTNTKKARELNAVQNAFNDYINYINKLIDQCRRQGFEPIKELIPEFRNISIAVRNKIESLQNEDIAALSEALALIDTMARNTRSINILLTGICIILAVMVTLVLTRMIVRPVNSLIRGTRDISLGDFSVRVTSYYQDELGQLVNAFNWMSEKLEKTMISKDELEALVDKRTRDLKEEIEKRKTAELTLSKARDELEIRVKERTKELIELTESLKKEIEERKWAQQALHEAFSRLKDTQAQLMQAEKMETVGRLAGGVAHEVKNPLAIIMQGTEYIAKKAGTKDENIVMVINDIIAAVKRADNIIRGLLDFASVSELNLTQEDLNIIIENALLLMRHQLTRNSINVVKAFNEQALVLKVDKNKIEQVFVNIFLNAIDAMPAGGTLLVKTYDKKLTQIASGVGRRQEDIFKIGERVIIVEIEDTGTGIPKEILNNIFEPFVTTKRAKGGTGLGLSVIKNIVDMHGGMIYIDNKEDSGVRATLMFKA